MQPAIACGRCDNMKKTDVVVSPPGEFHPLVGGDGALMLANTLRPEPAELRRMLRCLRKRLGLAQSFTAALLGVTRSAVSKWENGERTPTGAAAKMVFLLYSRLLDPAGKVQNVWDIAFWGRIPCRDSVQEAALLGKTLEIGGTYFVPEGVFGSVMGIESAAKSQAPGLRPVG